MLIYFGLIGSSGGLDIENSIEKFLLSVGLIYNFSVSGIKLGYLFVKSLSGSNFWNKFAITESSFGS